MILLVYNIYHSIYAAQRQIGETALNETSSRSHQIIRLVILSNIHQRMKNDSYLSYCSKVIFRNIKVNVLAFDLTYA